MKLATHNSLSSYPTPKYWARKDNADYIEEHKDYQGSIMLDFVEYGTENK